MIENCITKELSIIITQWKKSPNPRALLDLYLRNCPSVKVNKTSFGNREKEDTKLLL